MMNIVIFASGDFPYLTIKELINNNNFNISGIVTSHYHNINYDNIIDIGKRNNIPLYVVGKKESLYYNDAIKEWLIKRHAQIFCVISFKFLPSDILQIPSVTSFNIHASLLPLLKGAAPINWAIRYGLKETGLTSFILNNKIDSGDIVEQKKIKISKDDNFGSMYKKLSEECVDFTINTLKFFQNKNWQDKLIKQNNENDIKYPFAPKLTFTNTKLDINKDKIDIQSINRQIKSLSPYDGPHATLKAAIPNNSSNIIKEYQIKIYDAHIEKYNKLMYDKDKYKQCNIITDGKTYFYIIDNNIGKYVLSIDEIQIMGKKRLKIKEFLAGFQIARKENVQLNIS